MNAFDLSRAVLTFFEVYREQSLSPEEKRALFADMLAALPDERVCLFKGARSVLVNRLQKAHGELQSRPEAAHRPEGVAQASRKEPAQGHPKRK